MKAAHDLVLAAVLLVPEPATLSTTLGYTHLVREHLVREHLEALVKPEGEADRAESAQILAQRRVSGGARGAVGRG